MRNPILKRLTVTSMMTAVALVLVVLNFTVLPPVPFLKYDFADIPILIVTFIYGPLYGIMSTFVVSAVQAFFLSADGWFGGLMHIISTGALLIPAGIIYRRNKSRKTAVLGLGLGCITMTASMLAFNYFLDPIFYHIPSKAVVDLLPWIGLFNLIKSVANSVITFTIYKHIRRIVDKL